MVITLGKLKQIENSIKKIIFASEIDIAIKYRLRKLAKVVTEELEEYEQLRQKAVYKYGEEKNGLVSVTPENKELFTQEIEELLAEEIELPDVKINLEDIKKIELSSFDLANIDFIIEEN